MLKKIKRYLYGLFYGLKVADDEMFVSKNSLNSDINYTHQLQEDNIGLNLLKGEVTQEVEDLRYSTYAVYRESGNYEYIGDGVAVKKDKKKNDLNNFKFIQRNKIFCHGMNEYLNGDKEKLDEFTLKITYYDVTRFRLERYVDYILVEIINGLPKITCRFNKEYDLSNPMTKMFYNELVKLKDNNVNDMFNNLSSISFTTYKSQGEDDFIMYVFSNLLYNSFEDFNDYINITFIAKNFTRDDLTEKYFSQNQKKKYDNKDNKNLNKDYVMDSKYYCSECGSEMNCFDYDITKYDYGRGICIKCLEKYLTFDEKKL